MKIFRFINHNILNDETLIDQVGIVTIPDTALLIQKRPFFIPDFTQNCTAQLCFCIRIYRLGRSIHQHFARRYYQSSDISLGVHFVAEDLLHTLQEKGMPWDMALGFDNAVAIAEPVSLASSTIDAQIRINEDGASFPIEWEHLCRVADSLISYISQHYTLRQGDLLLIPASIAGKIVHIDDRLTLALAGNEVLSFNIK